MWNSAPSARLRRSSRTASPVNTIAASTNENGPNVETTSRSAATPAMRCSKFSRPQVARRGRSERATSAIPGFEIVPEADLVLSRLPAQVHLATVAHGREVHQAALEVAQHHLHRLKLAERALELEERLRHDLPRRPSAVRRSSLAKGLARAPARELNPRRPEAPQPLGHPFQSGVRLFDGVVARMLRHGFGSP